MDPTADDGPRNENKLTDYWKTHEITMSKSTRSTTHPPEWASSESDKKIKGLKSQNLRDHMTEAELIFTALAELSTAR